MDASRGRDVEVERKPEAGSSNGHDGPATVVSVMKYNTRKIGMSQSII